MATITVRKDNEGQAAPAAPTAPIARGYEPFRRLRDLMSWDPFQEMAPFVAGMPEGFNPSFEIKETPEGYLFKADVPGVKEADLQVTLTGNRLNVSGKREAERKEQTDTYYAYERSYGDFTRAFTLPDGIDTKTINAELKEGVLTISLKKTPEMQPQKIPVQSAAKKS